MNEVDRQYADLIAACLAGERVLTRNSECFRAICRRYEFAATPLVSARRTAWRNCLREWEWMMAGSEYVHDLHPAVRHWWEPFAVGGNLPYNYGAQFRCYDPAWGGFDQIQYLIDSVRDHPNSRRAVITTWHTRQMASGKANPTNCHGTVIQCFVEAGNLLTMYTYQRSADVVVGVPHNWAQYWSFLLWLAHRSGREVGRLIWEGGDCHVYTAHESLARRIFSAAQLCQPTPQLIYRPSSEEFLADDFSLEGEYEPVIGERVEMVV